MSRGWPEQSGCQCEQSPGTVSSRAVNKWAAGISDTLALGLLTEAIGLGLPLAALPFLNSAQAAHPAFGRSVKELREAGVAVLLGPEGYEPHVPHQGSKACTRVAEFDTRAAEWDRGQR
ncbi:MAG: hypothetical protein JO272_13915 [Pseudonocardiales bacterium]|nr:hypothetical protein [Pseudonocardiales bacterium]